MEIENEDLLRNFLKETEAMSSYLKGQIANRVITGEIDKQRIIRFINSYEAFLIQLTQ